MRMRMMVALVAGMFVWAGSASAQAGGVRVALANDVSGHSVGANGRIVFRCYGERCYLSEVWSPVEQNGRQVPPSRAEAHSSRERSGTYFAILGKPAK